MAVTTTNLGVITAYGDAVAAGYTGTKAEWQALMASYATVAEDANEAKNAAVSAKDTAVAKATEAATAAATANTAKDTATSKATEATTAANTATTKANEASASAQSIAQSASQIAQNTSDISELKEDLSATNAELADVRVGADGVTYGSAGAAVRGQLNDVQKTLNFDDIAHVTSRIDWNTVNKTITIGIGYIVYAGGYKRISSAITVTYTNFDNITVLMYDTENNNLIFVPFNSLHKGIAIALFNSTKIYMPYDYDNVYLDGEKITTANIYDGFTSFVENLNTQVNNIDAEVNAIKSTIDLAHEKENIYNQNNAPKSSVTNDNIWIINDLIIPVGTVLTSLTLYFDSSGEKSFDVSLWNEATGAKYYSESFTVSPNNFQAEIQFIKKIDVPTKIGFTPQASTITATSVTGHSLLYVPVNATSLENASFLNKWVINATITALKPVSIPVLNQEIHVGAGLEFEEIQYALDSLQSDYATIIVHPKDTPYSRFSLMRSLNSSYPWSGLTTVKHISIIGVDKAKCIIQSDTGNYDSPPAEIATNGIIKNLTFIATHSASDGTETTGSYAVHVDNRPADTNGMKLIFENCDFISYQTAAVGLGLYKNQDILFDSCNFKSITDSTWKPNNDYDSAYMCALGAYFMHTTMGYAGGNMFVRFRNCFLYHEGGAYTMRIADADTTQTALLEAINNTLWNGTDNNTGYHTTGNPIMQMPYNHGNNATGLNA